MSDRRCSYRYRYSRVPNIGRLNYRSWYYSSRRRRSKFNPRLGGSRGNKHKLGAKKFSKTFRTFQSDR